MGSRSIKRLLIIAAMLLEFSAELSIELGQIMLRHWEEEQMEGYSDEDLTSMVSTAAGSELSSQNTYDLTGESSIKRVSSLGGMKRVASGMSINSSNSNNDLASIDSSMKRVTSIGSMKRVASSQSITNMRRGVGSGASLNEMDSSMKRVSSIGSMKRVASGHSISTMRKVQGSGVNLNELDGEASKKTEENGTGSVGEFTATSFDVNQEQEALVDDNTFKQRLLRGITTILRSRLLMTIFTYNALYATTTVLLSFQRAELVVNRKSGQVNSVNSDTAFLAKINIASSLAVFALQASGLGALIANSLGQRGTLALMPLVRFGGVALLALSHARSGGKPPDLIFFLVMDEFTKVINFAVAKPVREGLWRGLSNEARYEAKPIVDTLANRWGGGSAAFLVALLDRIMTFTGVGEVLLDGTKQLLGFPPLLILCGGSAAWWTVVSLDLGNIRRNIDLELKKHQ